jgi:predicted nucleic acid-binding protein
MPIDTDIDLREHVLLDTSAAIALLVEDHDAHAAAVAAAKGRRLGLAGHAWFETYSVLTRLPPGRRRSPAQAVQLIAHNFGGSEFLDQREHAELGSELAERGVSGGATYDALVGACARQRGRTLITGDARAGATYRALGVDVELVLP